MRHRYAALAVKVSASFTVSPRPVTDGTSGTAILKSLYFTMVSACPVSCFALASVTCASNVTLFVRRRRGRLAAMGLGGDLLRLVAGVCLRGVPIVPVLVQRHIEQVVIVVDPDVLYRLGLTLAGRRIVGQHGVTERQAADGGYLRPSRSSGKCVHNFNASLADARHARSDKSEHHALI
jgi:hypothetical protein